MWNIPELNVLLYAPQYLLDLKQLEICTNTPLHSTTTNGSPNIFLWHLLKFYNTEKPHLRGISYIYKLIIRCVLHWESVQKILNDWYLIPSKLAKIYPSTLSACWRNCGYSGTPLYIWWTCPKLKPFWSTIIRLISSIFSTSTSLSPQMVLLSLDINPWPTAAHTILSHIFIAARLAIARDWKSPNPLPSQKCFCH